MCWHLELMDTDLVMGHGPGRSGAGDAVQEERLSSKDWMTCCGTFDLDLSPTHKLLQTLRASFRFLRCSKLRCDQITDIPFEVECIRWICERQEILGRFIWRTLEHWKRAESFASGLLSFHHLPIGPHLSKGLVPAAISQALMIF